VKIELYIKSLSPVTDYRYLSLVEGNPCCAPNVISNMLSEFQGRTLDPESAALLHLLEPLRPRLGKNLRVFDVGKLPGWLKAMLAGVWATPAVVLDGEKHLGFTAASQVLAARGVSGSAEEAAIVAAAEAG